MGAESYEMSIEALDGAFSAASWQLAYRDILVSSAISSGALEWEWHTHSWGVVCQLAFRDELAWERFRALPAVRAALDAVPDGLVVKRGWGGTAGEWEPRRPRPAAGAGSAALPIPVEDPLLVAAV
jgi:hypothetical protein